MSSVCSSIGAQPLHIDSLSNLRELTAAATERHDSYGRMRFNRLTLSELSEELDRRTKETQRLQEEVENATKAALERFGCKYGGDTSPGQQTQNHEFNIYNPPEDFTFLPTHSRAETLDPGVDISEQEAAQRQISSPGKNVLENAIDDCFQQLPELQTHDQTEQEEMFSFDKAIMTLQTKLDEVQMEKDFLSDLRLKDSRKHVDHMEKMLSMLEELQSIKRATDQKLQVTEEETFALNRKVEALEQILKEIYSSLLPHENQCGNGSITTHSRRPSSYVKLAEDCNNDVDELQERRSMTVGSEEHRGEHMQEERTEELIASLSQEMALLTDKLSSSKDNSVSLSVKLELLKKLTERHTVLHQCEISELVSTLTSDKAEVSRLEQQLLRVQSQLADAQKEKERTFQQKQELQSRLSQLKRRTKQQQCELQVEVKALRDGLEEAREQLHRADQEKKCLQALLDQRTLEGRRAQELLREKDQELRLRLQEAQQHLSRWQKLHEEEETLRLKLDDKEKLMDLLRLQLDSGIQATAKHNRTIDHLHQENDLLSNQLNQSKMETQQLRAELDQRVSGLAAAEHERRQLQASVAEQSRRVREETLEKRQLSAQLETRRLQLLGLTKEHEELQRLHICQKDEQEGVVLRLRSQLQDTQDELDRVRSTLRTLEGADGHGLRVALDMQAAITGRREQVDSLQSKIKHLEESVEKLHQEKHHQNVKNQQQLQELVFVTEEKKQLSSELEALRSKDQQLTERIGRLEAILRKMSDSFADCQDFIQMQDQDFYRLKLRHALDLKELQGQNLHTALNLPPLDLDSPNPSRLGAPPSSQHVSSAQIKTNPPWQIRSLVRELQGVISEKRGPHTHNGPAATAAFHRRRSAPEREHGSALAEKETSASRPRRKTCSSQSRSPKETEVKIRNKDSLRETPPGGLGSGPATTARDTSWPQLLSPGRRSPVHSLLTSDPNS